MDEGEINRQLHEQNELLRCENELLRAKVIELEARLAQYENAHTPPSLRRGRNRKKDQDKRDKGKPGQKIGHTNRTRSTKGTALGRVIRLRTGKDRKTIQTS